MSPNSDITAAYSLNFGVLIVNRNGDSSSRGLGVITVIRRNKEKENKPKKK